MKVIKVQKKQGKKDTFWVTIEYTKEELDKEFPSIEYNRVPDEVSEVFKYWVTRPPLTSGTIEPIIKITTV